MYLAELKIWNFRRFGQNASANGVVLPGLHLFFNKNVNLLVGENDTGKTAIIDSIKYVLFTRSFENLGLNIDDFHLPPNSIAESNRATNFRIECVFKEFQDSESKNFLEWLSINEGKLFLRVFLIATRDGRQIKWDCKAGGGEGDFLDSNARDLLRATYLKPLRDAESELSARKGSRISQILDSHEAFAEKGNHPLVQIVGDANKKIQDFFTNDNQDNSEGKRLHDLLDSYLGNFSDKNNPLNSRFSVANMRLKNILERLQLSVFENIYNSPDVPVEPGLGSNNILFIAAELLLLKKINYSGLRLGLIEEIEAHLHPQAQLRLIEYLQQEAECSGLQFILTTHSPILASKVKVENLILCNKGNAYPLRSEFTELEKGDYHFLERFLDATKANLFFARGIILVEGDAENLLVPTIAEIIGLSLTKFGVSVVNVGSTAFLRYSRIFRRKDSEFPIEIPVSLITDIDIRPDEYLNVDADAITEKSTNLDQRAAIQTLHNSQKVKAFVSPYWTLEITIALSPNFRNLLLKSILCAKMEEDSNQYTVTNKKLTKIESEILRLENDFKNRNLSEERIAFEIYYQNLIKKKISKAITAQWLAQFLFDERDKYKSILEQDKYIKYIVESDNMQLWDEDVLWK